MLEHCVYDVKCYLQQGLFWIEENPRLIKLLLCRDCFSIVDPVVEKEQFATCTCVNNISNWKWYCNILVYTTSLIPRYKIVSKYKIQVDLYQQRDQLNFRSIFSHLADDSSSEIARLNCCINAIVELPSNECNKRSYIVSVLTRFPVTDGNLKLFDTL